MKLRTLIVFVACLVAGAFAQKELDSSSFESTITGSKDTFVKFYAPWCGHCKRLAPTWTKLSEAFDGHDKVQIAKLDCTSHRDICGNHGVRGYPTLKYFKAGSLEGEKYQGGRDVSALTSFVNGKLE